MRVKELLEASTLPDGTYKALQSGYDICVKHNGNEYHFHSGKTGIRRMNVPVTIAIKDGKYQNTQE